MSYRFLEGESSAEGTRRLAREQIGKAVDRLEADDAGSGLDEAILDARKRIKKARAILRLARGPIGKARVDRADRRLGKAARLLSGSRDASALLATFDALTGAAGHSPSPEPIAEARQFLATRREEITRVVRSEGGPAAEAASALRSVRRRLGRWDLGDDDSDPTSGLKQSYRKGRAALFEILDDPEPESFHQLRKRVKDLGYQLQAVGSDPGGHASRLEELGRVLGELHDLDVLRSTLPRPEVGPILLMIDKRTRELRRIVLSEARTIFLDRPRIFARQEGRSP